jgi:hypothetical protein
MSESSLNHVGQSLVSVLQKPDTLTDATAQEWFRRIADELLTHFALVVGGQFHRFAEIEFYYFSKDHHPDPFTHRDPVQLESGRWYFHRTHGTYRSGSFKGLDLTFGDGQAHGGILIRGIEGPAKLIDGPSLCVDHLLGTTGARDVASLDQEIAGRPAWDMDSPLHLVFASRRKDFYRSGRVGLTLKYAKTSSKDRTSYILRPYRYLTEPRGTAKGKTYLVLALYAEGTKPEKIQQLTGCPKKSIERYIADYEAGKAEPNFDRYLGKDLTPTELCRLHGTWYGQMKQGG